MDVDQGLGEGARDGVQQIPPQPAATGARLQGCEAGGPTQALPGGLQAQGQGLTQEGPQIQGRVVVLALEAPGPFRSAVVAVLRVVEAQGHDLCGGDRALLQAILQSGLEWVHVGSLSLDQAKSFGLGSRGQTVIRAGELDLQPALLAQK